MVQIWLWLEKNLIKSACQYTLIIQFRVKWTARGGLLFSWQNSKGKGKDKRNQKLLTYCMPVLYMTMASFDFDTIFLKMQSSLPKSHSCKQHSQDLKLRSSYQQSYALFTLYTCEYFFVFNYLVLFFLVEKLHRYF